MKRIYLILNQLTLLQAQIAVETLLESIKTAVTEGLSESQPLVQEAKQLQVTKYKNIDLQLI